MTDSTPTRQRVAANLSRLLEGREAEVGAELWPSMAAYAAASNVRRFTDGRRFPGPDMLDRLAIALGVDVSLFFTDPR